MGKDGREIAGNSRPRPRSAWPSSASSRVGEIPGVVTQPEQIPIDDERSAEAASQSVSL